MSFYIVKTISDGKIIKSGSCDKSLVHLQATEDGQVSVEVDKEDLPDPQEFN